MARIPTSETLGQPGISAGITPVDAPRADLTSGAAVHGKAMANLGDSIEGAIKLGAKMRAEDDDFEMQKRFVDFDLQQEKKLEEAKAKAPADPTGFTETYRKSYDSDARAFFKDVPESQRDKYDLALGKRGAAYEGRAFDFELKGQEKYHRNDLDTQILGIQNNTMTDPDPARMRENVARAVSLVRASRIPNDEKQKKEQRTASAIEETAVRARIERGDKPEDILRDLRIMPKGQGMKNDSAYIKPHKDSRLATVVSSSGAEVHVNASVADRFAGLISDLEAEGIDIDGAQSGGYNPRNIRGTNKPSKHAHGDAVDINWSDNQQGDASGGAIGAKVGAEKIREIAARNGLTWGGDFSNPDPMHFEVNPSIEPQERAPVEEVKVAELGPADGKMTDVAEADPVYTYLSPGQRNTMIGIVRERGRAGVIDGLKDDIAKLRREGVTGKDEQGRTSLDRAKEFLTPKQLEGASRMWREAEFEHRAVAPLKDLNDDEYVAHATAMRPVDGPDYAEQDRAFRKMQIEYGKIRQLRRKDPALSVDDTEELGEAKKAIKVGRDAGTLTGPQAFGIVFDARLKAQAKRGIADMDQRILSKAEGADLLGIGDPGKAPNKKLLREAYLKASDKALKKYGPKYAQRAMDDAIAMGGGNKETRRIAFGAARKLKEGEALPPDVEKRLGNVEAADDSAKLTEPPKDETPKPDLSALDPKDAPKTGKLGREPTKREIEFYKAKGDKAYAIQSFEEDFGEGAADKYLRAPVSDKAPKEKSASPP